jgi:hypothetical protein
MARAASQSTIHPLDTMKVRMQAGKRPQTGAHDDNRHVSVLDRSPTRAAQLGDQQRQHA